MCALMQGVVIHFDELTRCGLIRDTDGINHYFRHPDVAARLTAGQMIEFGNEPDSLVVVESMGAEQRREFPLSPAASRLPPVQQPVEQPVFRVVEPPTSTLGFTHWTGMLVSSLALVSLVAGGREKALLGSVWGILAAALLAIQTVFFGIAVRRSRLRSNFWRILAGSVMAYLLQSCDGFEPDTAARAYGYTLIALFVVVYLLPYRSGE